MSFNICKITNFEFFRSSCNCMIIIRLMSVNMGILSHQCKMASMSRRPSFSWYIFVGRKNFLSGIRESLPERMKNGLSYNWMSGNILKLKTKSCSQSSLSHVFFLIHAFRKELNFPKMPFDCGWWRCENWCFMPNSDVPFWDRSFLNSIPLSVIRLGEPVKVAYICWRYTWSTVWVLLWSNSWEGIYMNTYVFPLKPGWKEPIRSHAIESYNLLNGFMWI